jgi:hypothetical protein
MICTRYLESSVEQIEVVIDAIFIRLNDALRMRLQLLAHFTFAPFQISFLGVELLVAVAGRSDSDILAALDS